MICLYHQLTKNNDADRQECLHEHSGNTQNRGKQGGALAHWQEKGICTSFPVLCLTDVCSLTKRIDEFATLVTLNKDFACISAFCLVESWLNQSTPDAVLHIMEYHLFTADWNNIWCGKSHEAGMCFYINNSSCTKIATILSLCSSELEALLIDYKPLLSADQMPPHSGRQGPWPSPHHHKKDILSVFHRLQSTH